MIIELLNVGLIVEKVDGVNFFIFFKVSIFIYEVLNLFGVFFIICIVVRSLLLIICMWLW